MAALNKKAEGGSAPTAHDSQHCTCNCAANEAHKQAPDAVLTFNGTALRHLREAQSVALRYGACGRVGRELRKARAAVESGIWACDYAEASR
jgi:hypothetical protein